MSSAAFFTGIGIALWLLGLAGLLVVKHALRRVIAVNLMGSGVFLVLVAQGSVTRPEDPVLQALVVTGLVVAVSATAFALRLSVARASQSEPSVKRDECL
jgi:multicomponent Na+:H+ antiporter subunit C